MLAAVTAWIEQVQSPDAGPVQRARIRVQHLLTVLLMIVSTSYTLSFSWFGITWAPWVLLPCMLAAPAGLFITRSGHPEIGGRVISWAIFLCIIGSMVARGGMATNGIAWLLMTPAVSLFLLGPRHGMTMSIATAVAYVVLWWIEYAGYTLPGGLPAEVNTFLPLLDYPIMALILGSILWVQAGIWERAEREALDAAQSRYTFLATMSHEIRTPLNGVLGLTKLLLDTRLDANQHQMVTTVHDSGRLLRALLDDVLDFSKIDSGHLEVEQVPLDLEALAGEIVRLWQGPASEKGLALEVRTGDGVPRWITGDPNKLRQILGNLVSNAMKFTERGHIHVQLRADKDRLYVEVTDTGIGISEDAIGYIFEAFRQEDGTASRRFGGTGLGLAISRKLARLMSGALTVETTQGEGSTFTLQVPLVPTAPEAADLTEEGTAPDLTGLDVLVAEDNAVNQLVIRRLLERHGVQVRIVPDGAQCIQEWRRHPPDLILMDCQMPVCDGYEATRFIREQGGAIPIIALTANSMPGDRARCLEGGMDAHLGKPIDFALLIQVLGQYSARPMGEPDPQRRVC